jgi:hypothetical protein
MLQVHFSRKMLVVLGILLTGPWLLILGLASANIFRPSSGRPSREAVTTAVAWTEGKPGPWGRLMYLPINLELPDEFVDFSLANNPPIRWVFHGFSKDKALAFLDTAGLSAAQGEVLRKAPWTDAAEGAAVTPGDELILGLSPAARSNIYRVLVEFPENIRQIDPICFRPEALEERLAQSELSPTSIALVRSLLYQYDKSLWLFADFEPALRKLPDDQERRRMVKTLSRKPTLLSRVVINSDTDVDALARYWGVDGRRKDIEPLLKAMKRAGEDSSLSILCLLPSFARERLYNHPAAVVEETSLKKDCFWTALNFFAPDQTDDRLNDMEHVRAVIEKDYTKILSPSQLGDVVFLAAQNDAIIHAAVYLADDVVFTKNGAAYVQPWILMRRQDMIDSYAVRYPSSGPLKTYYYRRKGL